jgi:HNH endonuclease
MGNPLGGKTHTLDEYWEYLWSQVDWDVDEPDRCWEWRGCINESGYGKIGIQGKRWLVHRYVYQEMVGPLTDGLAIMHSCDVPNCVNPRHLEEGTRTQNQHDMQARGRSRARHWGKGGFCVNGHPWDGNEYFYGRKRVCRSCKADEQRARRERKRAG